MHIITQRTTRKLLRGVAGGFLGIGLLLSTLQGVSANENGQAGTTGGNPSDVALAIPSMPAHALLGTLPRPIQRPPLPFQSPQVGPVIKRAFADDIERRTTAFLPEDLSKLTPIEMPTEAERWIRVDLSEQRVIAYEGDTPIRGFVVSSGLPRTPTVTGEFRIKTKVRSQTMSGGTPGYGYYSLPNVQWVQYFYGEYAFHGTYWHNDFGRPKSHGCINMTNADARWLFDWASPVWDGKTAWLRSNQANPGTLVIVSE